MQNYRFYNGEGFPKGFPTLLNNWSCPVCVGMKSQRQYRTTSQRTPNRGEPRQERLHEDGSDTESDSDSEDNEQISSAPAITHNTQQPSKDHYYIDFGYSIAVGLRKEKYFLLIQLKEINFIWALPTASRDNPVSLLQDFENLTGIIPLSIQCDNEFANNAAVAAWAKRRGAVLRPVAAYNHTMNGRIEGAIRISKRSSLLPYQGGECSVPILAICT